MKRRIGAACAAGLVAVLVGSTPAFATGRADETVTITCEDFLGTYYQVVDSHANGVLYIGNVNYTNHNGFGGTCSAF